MKVLLTGAGGAIGPHMLAHLMTATDWDVICTDSFRTEHKGYYDRLTCMCAAHPDWVSRLRIFPHDLTAPFTEREIASIGPIDFIINLASRSDVSDSIDPSGKPTGYSVDFVMNNVSIMATMLEYARVRKPKVFIQFSTDEVYGPAQQYSKGHPEWDAIIPSNPYSASKAMQEAMAVAWWRTYDVPIIITNTMNNFGEMQAPSKFPAMIQQKLERGETIQIHANDRGECGTRYYLHSRNAADAVLFILKNITPLRHSAGADDRPDRFNIVGDRQIDNEELVKLIAHIMGKEPVYEFVNFHDHNPGHDMHYGLDGSKLRSLGWKAPLSFEESLENTIKWQQEHPEWMQ